jgi:hypothetical protein
VTVFQLPQRFQLVHGLSDLEAGLRLVPFGSLFPLGCVFGAKVASKLRVPPIFLVFVGSMVQIVGFALLSTISATAAIPPAIYGYEILGGFGLGINYQCLYLMIPFTTEPRDHGKYTLLLQGTEANPKQAVSLAVVNQLRMMGGATLLAIATSVFNGYTLPRLESLGMPGFETRNSLIQYLASAPPRTREDLNSALAEGYNRQMLVLAACAAAQIPVAALLWKSRQIMIP